MFDLYFSYSDAFSKKIILFIYNNKKIVEKNKIFNYLIEYLNQLKKKADIKESFDNTEKQIKQPINQPKPYIVCENKLSSLYGFVDFL